MLVIFDPNKVIINRSRPKWSTNLKPMRKIKQLTLGMSFFVALLFSTPAKAGHNNGNYVNGDGCLVVWES